ncbi:MAG: acyl-protein synthetase [Clostridiales bacterium]|jgi:phenylacetate-coenzyme A ligase PaaK-like adenylate-forming protein|nr:acyl-protein synthetase [Clostridiales bacterium]
MGLYYRRKIYDTDGTDAAFVRAVSKNVIYHQKRCPEYAALLGRQGFCASELKNIDDLYKLPPIPTLFLKNRTLYSVPEKRLLLRSATSGTGGKASHVGLDLPTVLRGAGMVLGGFMAHRLISLRRTGYIVLGYEPAPRNNMGAVKSAYAATLAAPAYRRVYALRDAGTSYELNMAGLKSALIRYAKVGVPVRFIGFPAYFLFLLKELEADGLRFRLHPKSRILLGGGWKQFFSEQVDKQSLYALSEKLIGLGGGRFKEFFGVVEHPVIYLDCPNHHFHVPAYARIIIRDTDMRPVALGVPGILNLITPIMTAMPHVSILTDDLAVLRPGSECGCGIKSPYFEILGRAGVADIKTCAAGAAELLSVTEAKK